MQLQITGHGLEITPALRELTEKKLRRIQSHFDHITNIHITFAVNKQTQIAEGNIQVPGTTINAQAESHDMYKSVDLLMEKLMTQLTKHKEKIKNR